MKNHRICVVDSVRGTAIVLMLIYHFVFDLNHFGYVDISFHDAPWRAFRTLIVGLFLGCVGASLVIRHTPRLDARAFAKSQGVLALAAIAVSVGSYHIFPKSWIYFGILHSIFVMKLLSIPFLGRPRLAALLAVLIFALDLLDALHPLNIPLAMPLAMPLSTLRDCLTAWLPATTEDFVPIIPWFAYILLGIAAAGCCNLAALQRTPIPTLAWLSRHSLAIYLIHQPILFAGFYALTIVQAT